MNAIDNSKIKSKGLKREFDENGFIVRRSFFSKDEMRGLLEEIEAASRRLRKTGSESTDRMHFYHNLYRVSPFLQGFSSQPKIVDLLRPLIGPSFWMRWDHAILKSPGGQEYPWHQDNAYSGLKDPYFQFWIAATDCDEKSGGIYFQPGSHRRGLARHTALGNHTTCGDPESAATLVSAQAGDVAVFSSFLRHRAGPNASSADRWVHIIEYMSDKHFDPTIPPPYFRVAENGKSAPGFVRCYKGSLNPWNHLKYLRRHRGLIPVRKWMKQAAGRHGA